MNAVGRITGKARVQMSEEDFVACYPSHGAREREKPKIGNVYLRMFEEDFAALGRDPPNHRTVE